MCSEKTTGTTSAATTRATQEPFFGKAGGGSFLEGTKQNIQRKPEKQEGQRQAYNMQDLQLPIFIDVPEGFHAFTIYSISGEEIYTTERIDGKEDFSKRIETNQFKGGAYYIVFKLGNGKEHLSKFFTYGEKTTLIIKSLDASKEDKNNPDIDKKDNIIIMPYGEWYTVGLISNKSNAPEFRYGIDTYIIFKPNEKVDAKQIGIIQSATAKFSMGVMPPGAVQNENGNVFENKQIEKRATEEGVFIDHRADSINPLYASKGGAGLGKDEIEVDKQSSEKHGRHGEHYYVDGKLHEVPKNAYIFDTPYTKGIEDLKNVKYLFETTALALSGKDKGTYYGSINWGFEIDGKGVLKNILPTQVSEGTPSPSFIKASKKWNESKGGLKFDQDTEKIPIPD